MSSNLLLQLYCILDYVMLIVSYRKTTIQFRVEVNDDRDFAF